MERSMNTKLDVDPAKTIHVYFNEEPRGRRVLRILATVAAVLAAVAGGIMILKKKK